MIKPVRGFSMPIAADIQRRYAELQKQIAATCARAGRNVSEVTLIAVTKTHPLETVQAVVDCRIRQIGENRVQEIIEKAPGLNGDYTLHLIGHLQTNKVAKAVGLVDWIQSVDSSRLLNKIDRCCRELHRTMNILVQVNTSGEQQKHGCRPEEAIGLCEEAAQCENVSFRGLMTIGPLIGGEAAARRSFVMLREIGEKCRHLTSRLELSMGMSGDFLSAIEEGATMVRVGSRLLGERG